MTERLSANSRHSMNVCSSKQPGKTLDEPHGGH